MTKERAQFVDRFEDYRKVKGVLRPHKTSTTIDGEPFAEATVTGLELNPDVPDAAFEKPAGGS
jgi:hypothetical protein